MIIWSGLGFLAAIIGLGSLVLTEFVTEAVLQDDAYYQAHGWPKLVAFWIAAGLVFLLARVLDRQPGRTMIDKASGQEVTLKKKHALFFIPLRYWSLIFLGLGVIFLFVTTA